MEILVILFFVVLVILGTKVIFFNKNKKATKATKATKVVELPLLLKMVNLHLQRMKN